MPRIKSGFTLLSKAPNFERDSFETLFDLKNANAGHIDDGHISYCREDGKHYVFNSNNSFDEVTGFFRVFQADLQSTNEVINKIEITLDGHSSSIEDLIDRVEKLEQMINELYKNEYKVTCSISPSKSVIEHNGLINTVTLNVSIRYKNELLNRNEVKRLSISPGLSADIIGDYGVNVSTVDVLLSPGHGKNHTFNLSVNAMDQNVSSSCTIYERAPIFIGWSQKETPDKNMFVNSDTELFKRRVTNSSLGTYNFGTVGIGYYFWVLIPNTGVTEFTKINANGYEMQMNKQEQYVYNGVTYNCYRKPEASTISSNNWKIVLS